MSAKGHAKGLPDMPDTRGISPGVMMVLAFSMLILAPPYQKKKVVKNNDQNNHERL